MSGRSLPAGWRLHRVEDDPLGKATALPGFCLADLDVFTDFLLAAADAAGEKRCRTQPLELSYIPSNASSPRISSSTPSVSVTSPKTVAR